MAERIDLAIRIGALRDSSMVARRLGTVGHRVYASPSWLMQHSPVDPATLVTYPRIVDTNQPQSWRLTGPDGKTLEVEARGRYAVNNAHAARDACRAGLGLALLPTFLPLGDDKNKALVDALPGWRGPELGLFAVVLERRWLSPAVRALVDHVRGLLKEGWEN